MKKLASSFPLATTSTARPAINEASGPSPQVPASVTNTLATDVLRWILQAGVILSAAVIMLGLLLLPLRPGGLTPERVLAFPATLNQVREGLLIFVIEQDRRYVLITLIVLAILLLSLFLGGKSYTIPVDMAIIDASHSFHNVLRELNLLWPRLSWEGRCTCSLNFRNLNRP